MNQTLVVTMKRKIFENRNLERVSQLYFKIILMRNSFFILGHPSIALRPQGDLRNLGLQKRIIGPAVEKWVHI